MSTEREFRAYSYDIQSDKMSWRPGTRSGIIRELACSSLVSLYGSPLCQKLGHKTLIRRAVVDGLHAVEMQAITADWQAWWSGREEAVLEGRELVSPEAFAEISATPTADEVCAAIEPHLGLIG